MYKYVDYEVLVFDLGNTILPIAPDKTIAAFNKLGLPADILNFSNGGHQTLESYQKGKLTTDDFLSYLKGLLPVSVKKEQIIAAWNAMLLDFPQEHFELLKRIKSNSFLILLSNTNALHTLCFEAKAREKGEDLHQLFDAICYSQELGMSKPTAEIYYYVHKTFLLEGRRVLFLDDLEENLSVPERLGWEVFHIKPQQGILSLG